MPRPLGSNSAGLSLVVTILQLAFGPTIGNAVESGGLRRPAPTRIATSSGILVARRDWLHDAFTPTDDNTYTIAQWDAFMSTPGFDTTAAVIKTGHNIAPLTGEPYRPVKTGDSLVACACGSNVRMDLVFRILPGPGNYKTSSPRHWTPGGTPQGVLLDLPTNQNSAAVAGSASFWGQYLADPGVFGTPGGHHGGTQWDPNTWNSARMDTAEMNCFPIQALGNLPQIEDCIWMGMYHESDPKYATLGIVKNRCFLKNPAGPVTFLNSTCTTVPGWVTANAPGDGYDGSQTTREYTKIIPDGNLTPGSHVQYFLRRSELATPSTFTMTPDTTRVLPQPDELATAPTSCQSPVNDPGSVDGHRWQDFGILPDRWKDTAFGGPGMACMLYVNYDEGRGDEYAWVTAADLIGATQPAKFGAHNGWHINSLADDPNDQSNFVSTHGGQAGSTWDMYRVHGVDDPVRGFAGSIGSRSSGSQPGDGTPWEMASNIGPYPSALPHSYHLIYITTGDHEDIEFGPINDRGQNDVAVVEHYLTHPSTYSQSMLFIQGSGFSRAENEAAGIYPYHPGFLSDYLATGLVNDDFYAQANVPSAPCLDLVVHPALAPPLGVTLGIDNTTGQTNDVLGPLPGPRPVSVTSEYDPTLGIEAPYNAGILATEVPIRPFRTLVDGFALKHVVTSDCGSPVGRLSYLYDVFTTVFENCGDLPPVAVPPEVASATSRSGIDLLDLPVRGTSIQVRLRLAQPDHVDAVLFDLGGREVAQVASRDLSGGVHVLSWEATRPDGRRLAPGAYFLRVVFARQDFRTTRKVIILPD